MPVQSWRATGTVAAIVALGMVVLQQWPGMAEALQFSRPRYEQGAVWQLLSSQWVHLSTGHALANAVAFAVLVLASRRWVTLPRQAVALLGGVAGVALVLALDAQCRYYAGASGALHGLLAGNIVWLWLNATRPSVRWDEGLAARRWAPVLLGLLLFKLWLQASGTGVEATPGWGFPVYHPAHLAGTLGGGLLSLVLGAARARTPTAQQGDERE